MTVSSFDTAARLAAPVQGVSLWQSARRRLVRNRAAMGGLIVLTIIGLLSIFGPLLSPHAYDDVFWDMPFSAPPDFANSFYFGTDANGRDLFVRTLYGARISLMVGILASTVSLVIGVAYGATAGFLGGHADNVMMRIVDIMYSLPFMFFVILLTVFFGRNIFLIFIAIGAVEWLDMARIVRGQTLALNASRIHRGSPCLRRVRPVDHPPAHHPQHPGPGHGVRDADRAQGDPARILPVLPGARRAGADDELGRADRRRRPHHGERAASAALSRHLPCRHAVLAQFPGDGLRDALDPKDR